MVERQKEKYHWEFIFLGANIDAVEVAGRFGVDKSRAVTYECDSAGTRLNYQIMGKMVSCARAATSATWGFILKMATSFTHRRRAA